MMRGKIYPFWRSSLVQLLAVFVLCLAVFAYLQPIQAIADPDSWYHVRLTTMMRDGGLVKDFPWTQSSLYKKFFIDHHLLYHVLLLPFVSLITHDLAGAKVATVFFAALSATAVLWSMRQWRVPYWGWAALLLLTSSPFLFRLSLVKAPSLAIGVAVVAFYLISQRKLGWLFFWTWFYVWFYSAWPLVVFMSGIFVAMSALGKIEQGLRAVCQEIVAKENIKLLLIVALGVLAGIIINPYFPVNLAYLKQIFSMALIPYHTFIGIGGEWYPMKTFDLPEYLSYPLMVWLIATLMAVFTLRRQSTTSRTAWLLALIFLYYTTRARRQTEYLVPWLIISSGLMLRDAGLGNVTWRYLKEKFSSWVPLWLKKRYIIGVLTLYALIVIPWGLSHGLRLAKALLAQGYGYNIMSGTSYWLKNNTPPGSIVFQSDWGMFPMMWYNNSQNYYLTGLDQTFMYEYDKEKYRQWERVVKGEARQIYHIAREMFGASYLIMEKRTPAMLMWLNRDSRFVKVYEDAEAIVFELK